MLVVTLMSRTFFFFHVTHGCLPFSYAFSKGVRGHAVFLSRWRDLEPLLCFFLSVPIFSFFRIYGFHMHRFSGDWCFVRDCFARRINYTLCKLVHSWKTPRWANICKRLRESLHLGNGKPRANAVFRALTANILSGFVPACEH